MRKLSFILLFTMTQLTAIAGEIQYSLYLPNESRNILIDDFKVLNKTSFSSTENSELNLILKIDKLTNTALTKWINTRVSYIVEEQFNNDDQDIFVEEDFHNSSSNSIFMTNYGAAVFSAAQKQDLTAGFFFTNQDNIKSTILIHTPRVGLLKLGAALFNPEYLITDEKTAHANSLNRLSIIAHEARHSDGNNESLGFRHERCPKGHYLSGMAACDYSTNGAYSVSSLLLREFTKVCAQNCTISEKQTLLMTVLDNASRIIRTSDASNDWDESPHKRGGSDD